MSDDSKRRSPLRTLYSSTLIIHFVDFYALPLNVSTQVDLLEAHNISWATYQENMPFSGFSGDYAQKNYLDLSSKSPYTYYMVSACQTVLGPMLIR